MLPALLNQLGDQAPQQITDRSTLLERPPRELFSQRLLEHERQLFRFRHHGSPKHAHKLNASDESRNTPLR
jgi:hypothetical protein